MEKPAGSWWDEMRQEAEGLPASLPEPPRGASKAPVLLGAAAAAAIAAGLGWWLTQSDTTTFQNRESARLQPAAAAPATLPGTVDADQVRRAVADFRATAPNGSEALGRFRDSCAAQARADGRLLDFCLAFDIMGDTTAPADPEAEARRLALVQAALPGEAAPAGRVAAVRAALISAGAMPAVAPRAQEPTETPPADAAPATTPSVPKAVVAAKPAPSRAAKATSPCERLSTPADRLVCATPALKTQHARMRAAYEAALENGADPLAIDRGQAQWRTLRNAAHSRADLSALYARRIAELKAAAEEARLTPPN